MLILTVLAVGVGHRNSIGVKLSRYSIDRLQCYYIAKAAIAAVKREIEKDTQDPVTKEYDTLYSCGISLDEEEKPEDIFKEIPLGQGHYSLSYKRDNQGDSILLYGLIDEERKINLNAINMQSYKVLEKLLELFEVESELAKTIASSVVDWRDEDSNESNPGYGADDDYYMGLDKPYHCKITDLMCWKSY